MPKTPKRRNTPTPKCDLFVPVPVKAAVKVDDLLARLETLGYTHVALTHTIYGKPKRSDAAGTTIPWQGGFYKKMQVYRRLHAVIENASDVAAFTTGTTSGSSSNNNDSVYALGYDVVSMAVRNNDAWQAVCSNNASLAVNIQTIDYNASNGRVPFRINSSHIQTMLERNCVIELVYAPAVVDKTKRRAWMTAASDIKNAMRSWERRVGKTNILLVSSGMRQVDGKDVGITALRTPIDVQNLHVTMLQFNPAVAAVALSKVGKHVIDTARIERLGKKAAAITSIRAFSSNNNAENTANDKTSGEKVNETVTTTTITDNTTIEVQDTEKSQQITSKTETVLTMHDQEDKDDMSADDGFIAF